MCAIRLFFGGFHRIKIVNLSLIDTKQVFGDFIAAMCYFDKMISGGDMLKKVKGKKKFFDILKALIDFSLDRSNKPKFDPYIIDSFHSLRQHKRKLVFELYHLSFVDKNIRNLVLYSCEHRMHSNESKREFGDLTNLFRAELLSIFPNVEEVIIKTSYATNYSYSLPMSNLLSIISSSSLNRVVVDAQHFNLVEAGGQWGPIWINTLWRTESDKLTQEFASNGFTISYEEKGDGAMEYFKFIIVRN